MLEKWADKAAKVFSKKAVAEAKQAVVEDVKQNQTGYIMSGITGIVIAVGVVTVVKVMLGHVLPTTPSVPTYSVTYNYYITLPKGEV